MNGLAPGVFYNGDAKNRGSNIPTALFDNSIAQIAAITIVNGSGNRGYQIAFTSKGIGVRFKGAGGYVEWKTTLFE